MPIALLKTLTGAWDQVRGYLHDDLERIEMELNLPTDASDIVGNLPINVLPNIPAGTLLGRGSASGNGPAEEIDLGPGLVMNGTTLQVNASGGGGGARGLRGRDGAQGPRGPQGPPGSSSGSFNPDTLYWTLATNGDDEEPELVFAGGDVVWVQVP